MRAGAGPVEPVPLRAVHPHGDLQVNDNQLFLSFSFGLDSTVCFHFFPFLFSFETFLSQFLLFFSTILTKLLELLQQFFDQVTLSFPQF